MTESWLPATLRVRSSALCTCLAQATKSLGSACLLVRAVETSWTPQGLGLASTNAKEVEVESVGVGDGDLVLFFIGEFESVDSESGVGAVFSLIFV